MNSDSNSSEASQLVAGIQSGSTVRSGFIRLTASSSVKKVEVLFDSAGSWVPAAKKDGVWIAPLPQVGGGTIWATNSAHTVKAKFLASGDVEVGSAQTTFRKGISQDYNGDGYEDLVLGAPDADDGGTDRGIAYVYYGSASGVPSGPSVTLKYPGTSNTANFGMSIHSAGDLNADGYADLAVGAPGDTTNTGILYVYYGSLSGISPTPDRTITIAGLNTGSYFAETAMSAGDTNKDGYDDLIAGAWGANTPATNAGKAFVFHGSATGINSAPDLTIVKFTTSSYKLFGRGISAAGDVNGDGYADVVIGAHLTNPGGHAYVYYGSASGLSTTSNVDIINPGSLGANFGRKISGLGDVNNDGFSDFVVTGYTEAAGGTNRGAVYVFYGSAAGPSTTPNQTFRGAVDNGNLGMRVVGGADLDGDSFSDLIVGSQLGASYLHKGSAVGVSTSPISIPDPTGLNSTTFGDCVLVSADHNADGLADLVIGDPFADTAGTDRGAAYLYYSAASSSSVGKTLLYPGTDDGAGFSRTKR